MSNQLSTNLNPVYESVVEVVETGYYPHRFQQEIIDSWKRFNVLVCHRRFGKTVCAINALIDAALDFPRNDGRFAYVAPFMNQARAVAWDYVKLYTQNIPGMAWKEQSATAVFPNGCTIRLFGADNADAMRGLYMDGICCDEVADMKPNVWAEILRPCLADRVGWAIFIGTVKGINLFSELYFAALENPDWTAMMFRASETMLIPQEELDAARETMSASQYAQEWECDWNASTDNTLITIDMVVAAADNHLMPDDVKGSPKILGVDVARYGDDRCCIFPRQGLIAFKPKVYKNIDNMTFAACVVEAIKKWKPDAVFIDAGRGEGVIDRVRQLGYNAIEVNFGGTPADPHYVNKRAEMWDKMRIWLGHGAMIPSDGDLKSDLCIPTYTYANAANKFALESKDSIKDRGLKSPDLGDALALTFAHEIGAKDSMTDTGLPMQHINATGGKGISYDPIEEI